MPRPALHRGLRHAPPADAALARAAAHHAGRQGLQTPRILAGRAAHQHVLDDAPIQRVTGDPATPDPGHQNRTHASCHRSRSGRRRSRRSTGIRRRRTCRRSGTGCESRSRSGTGTQTGSGTRCDQPCRPIRTRQRPTSTTGAASVILSRKQQSGAPCRSRISLPRRAPRASSRSADCHVRRCTVVFATHRRLTLLWLVPRRTTPDGRGSRLRASWRVAPPTSMCSTTRRFNGSQGIQRHRIQGTRIERMPHATDPDRDGGGHGDQRESGGGERAGDPVRDASRGHGAEPGRRQGAGRGVISPADRSEHDRDLPRRQAQPA